MKIWITLLAILFALASQGQNTRPGIIVGNVLDDKSAALQGATVQLIKAGGAKNVQTTQTDATGAFAINNIAYGVYNLRISYTGMQTVQIDSIAFRKERFDFNMNDIVLKPNIASSLDAIIIYAEKPLIQSKEGNITFNAGESALSAGSNASDLLASVPMVTKDPDGKITVRGKEPKILIDEKPVDVSLEELQDLLESMPGSTIEKIEVMTNPPPQYANEEGGVINIVTRKGTVGTTGRLSVYTGTRGEKGVNASYNYRRRGLSININAGLGANNYNGEGYSNRQNIYSDSTNNFVTNSSYSNTSQRPNLRGSFNYDINKNHGISLVLRLNKSSFDNESLAAYYSINNFGKQYGFSERNILSSGSNFGSNVSFSYNFKSSKEGENLKLVGSINSYSGKNSRNFYQQYFTDDQAPNFDSTQRQLTENENSGTSLRLNYNLPLNANKTILSAGAFYNVRRTQTDADAAYLKLPEAAWVPLSALTNNFLFHEYISNVRGSVKQKIGEAVSVTAGIAAEQTRIKFDATKANAATENNYWTYLPFASANKRWNNDVNLTVAYRRTIRRPGAWQLNPTVDSSDQFNIRSGNPNLNPSLTHNFDVYVGKSRNGFYANAGLSYNIVEEVFTQLRVAPTEITWQNIAGRKEYGVSTWSGYTLNRKIKLNLSAHYNYNVYSDYDRNVRKYRNGGSLGSNFSLNYNFAEERYNTTASLRYNRFANPQGTVRSRLSMNLGLQAKLLDKKLWLTATIVDPFANEKNHTFTYGNNFILENLSTARTRSFRLSVSYTIRKSQRKKTNPVNIDALKSALPTNG